MEVLHFGQVQLICFPYSVSAFGILKNNCHLSNPQAFVCLLPFALSPTLSNVSSDNGFVPTYKGHTSHYSHLE